MKLILPSHLHMFEILSVITMAGHVNDAEFRSHAVGRLLCEGINGHLIMLTEVSEGMGSLYPQASFKRLENLTEHIDEVAKK